MTDSAKKQPVLEHLHGDTGIYEDEINLIDYFLVILKYKWFIAIVSILPAMVVGVYFYMSPRDYAVTYVYDNIKPNQAEYSILVSQIYSKDNIDKIIKSLQKNDFDKFAGFLRSIEGRPDRLKECIGYEVFPDFFDVKDAKLAGQLLDIQKIQAQLINMTVVAEQRYNPVKIALVLRENFEKVMPVKSIESEIEKAISQNRSSMASIEEGRFSIELELTTNKNILEQLKKIEIAGTVYSKEEVVLQFDVGQKSQYLPLEYQVRATETMIVELQSQLEADKAKYEYSQGLLDLNQKIHKQVQAINSSGGTIEEFKSLLIALASEQEADEIKDYLSAYTKRTENRILSTIPVSENPTVVKLSKGTVKKSGLVFVAALMLSVFASFIREGFKKNQ